MKISFVIYFHSKRIKNLLQSLRFLNKREELKNSEFVLVCQDSSNKINDIRPINLNLDSYNKSKMCNVGVDKAKNEIVALLDSDRVLPNKYFDSVFQSISPGQFVSTWKMYKLLKEYEDEEIENGKIKKKEDFKSVENLGCKKNLFAGNTVFFKKDYMDSGGMDESYVAYGFADTDMTQNIMSKNYNIVWRQEEELHLHHEKEVYWKNQAVEKFAELSTACNAIRYYKKWKKTEEDSSVELINWAKNNFHRFPEYIKKDKNFNFIFGNKIYL